jgi:hypothetical protein
MQFNTHNSITSHPIAQQGFLPGPTDAHTQQINEEVIRNSMLRLVQWSFQQQLDIQNLYQRQMLDEEKIRKLEEDNISLKQNMMLMFERLKKLESENSQLKAEHNTLQNQFLNHGHPVSNIDPCHSENKGWHYPPVGKPMDLRQ